MLTMTGAGRARGATTTAELGGASGVEADSELIWLAWFVRASLGTCQQAQDRRPGRRNCISVRAERAGGVVQRL